MSNIVFPVVVFYTVLIVLFSLIGVTTAEDVAFPEFPTLPNQSAFLDKLGVFGFLVAIPLLLIEFIAYLFIIFGFFLKILAYTFTDLMPFWLSTIIFLPLVVVTIYEITARLIRGS